MIALVDCNNFYASCQRLFEPRLRNKPVVVLSNNDGCIIARSSEAKALGIQMGAAAFQMEDFLTRNDVEVYSSNYALYGSLSDRVMATLNTFTPVMEVYSIDEAFLDFSTMKYHDLHQLAFQVTDTVKQNIGIPVSVGIAPTKTLAKMANRFAKKMKIATGIHVLDTTWKIEQVLNYTEVQDIWGIGPEYAKLLKRYGFKTAFELSNAPENWVRETLTVVGHRLWKELTGTPCIQLEEVPAAKKNVTVARSFGELLTKKEDIAEALANYTATAAKKLRKQDSCARLINVFLQTNNFRTTDPQYFRSVNIQLPVATNSTRELLKYATIALNRIWRNGYKFKKIGVMLLELVPADEVQLGLFDKEDRKREDQLMKVLDAINKKCGRELVTCGRQSGMRRWKLRQEKLSPCYTTRLSDILTVNI